MEDKPRYIEAFTVVEVVDMGTTVIDSSPEAWEETERMMERMENGDFAGIDHSIILMFLETRQRPPVNKDELPPEAFK